MARVVYVPELGRAFSFPEGTSDQAVSSFFKSNFPAPPPVAAPAAPPAPAGPDESGLFGTFAYDFGTGLTNIPGGIASLLYPAEESAQMAGGRFSESARQYLQEALGVDPTKERTTPQMLAGALGSVASFLIPGGAVAKGVSLLGRTAATAARAGTATAAAQGAALGAEQRSERIRQQLESGMVIPEETQLEAQRWSGIIGTLEAAPVKRFFEPLNVLLSKVPASKAPIVEQIVKSRLGKITRAGIAEGAQEAASGIANDLMEYGVYNPNVKIGEDLLSNAGTGAFAGSVVEGLVQLAAGRKLRPYRELQEDITRESFASAQAQRQGEISRATEELRQYNVDGDVEIVEEEFDGLPRFRIRTPAGNAVGDFLDAAEAEEALDIYRQRTDAKVTVRRPAELPSVFPVKIGGKEYQTTDEIIAARDTLVSQADGLAAYMARPDVIRREAARQNVSEDLVRKATDQEVGELNNQIAKLNDFLAAAKPETVSGDVDLAEPVVPAEAIAPEPIAVEQEPPIGAVMPEVPVEEPRFIEEEAPNVLGEPAEPTRVETRPSATAADLEALQTELFGAPKNVREMTAEEEARYVAERDRRFPPEQVELYSAAPLRELPVRRRTLSQAEAEGPVIRALNQETIDRYAKIYQELRNRLSGIVPKDADIRLTELIDSDKSVLIRGQARAEKTPNGIKSIVDLATGIMRPDMTVEQAVKELVNTLNHEIIHVLRTQGVIRPAEWRILSRAAGNTRVPDRRYTYLDKAQAVYTPNGQPIDPLYADPDAVIEEAVADMYRDWVRNQNAPQQTRGLFNRITEFFRRIFRTLKSSQYEDIFGAIESGEVGAREGVARDTESRLSAETLPPEYNSQKTQIPGTFPTYQKASDILNRIKPDGRSIDFGAGLGMSQQLGFDTFEPYPRAGFEPTYRDSGDIEDGSYDKIANLNVLNVVPAETRSKIVREIGRILAPDGVAVVTTRGRDVLNAKGRPGPEPMSIITSANTYQKGFTPSELVSYLTGELGPGFTVERISLGPAGAIIRKAPEAGPTAEGEVRFSAAPAVSSEEFRRWFKNSRVVDRNKNPMIVYHHGTFTSDGNFVPKTPMHFGTLEAARERAFGKRTEESLLAVTAYQDDSGLWHWDDGSGFTSEDAGEVGYIRRENAIAAGRSDVLNRDENSDIDVEDLGVTVPVYLSLQNLKRVPDVGGSNGEWDAEIEKAKAEGYDGIVYKNLYEDKGSDSYIAFYPEQVKTPDSRFSSESQDIRFSAAPLPPYVEAKNRTLFVPEKKESVAQSIFNFFLGPSTEAKTLNTVYGQVDLEGGLFGTRANLYRRMSVVDQDAYVEFLEKIANEKDTGNFQRREARQSAVAALGWARRRSQLTASSVMLGAPTIEFATTGDIQSATVAVREDADNLLNIFKVMLEPGPVDSVTGEQMDKRTVFKSYATAKRAIGLKAAGKPVPAELDDTYINTTIQFTEQNYPEIVEAYKSYQRFNKKLLMAARDAGRITDAELAKFTQQMDYYGFYREIYEEELVPGLPTKLAGEIKLREYRGSQRGELIEDPMVVIISNVDFWMGAITRNIAVNKAFKLAKDMGEARLLGSSEKPDPSRGESEQVMFFREKGVLKRFAVSDPMLVASLGTDDRIDMGRMMGLLAAPTGFLRESITRDPAFMIANLVRDTLSSWITSGEDITPFIGTAAGFAKALKGSASFNALMGRGVVGSHDIAMRSPAEMATIIRRRALPTNVLDVASIEGAQNMVASLWDKLGVLSEASDAATRIAVYEAAIKQGMSEAEAAFRAIEIMNFSRRGSNSLLRLFTQLIPFLNARIQGMDVLWQAGKAGWMTATGYKLGERDANLGKKFLVRGAILAAISIALEAMLEDDEDYNDLPDYVKNGNILIPLKWFGVEGGYFAAIAKPFEAGLIFSTLPQEFYKATTGETSGREIAKLFWSEFTSTFGVNPIPQVALPALEALVNYDFYTDLPLISEGKARLAPELQYDSRTSTVAMMLGNIPIKYNFTTGKFEGISPIIIDQMISGYGGPFGTYLMQGTGMLMELGEMGIGDVQSIPERLPRDVTQLPLVKRFLLDAESRSPKSVAQAYELFRIVDEANRSFSRLRQIGNAEAVMDYLEENKDVLSYKKYVYKLVDGLNKISAYERRIEQDQTMTREEKVEAIKKLREVRARLTSNIREINRALGR